MTVKDVWFFSGCAQGLLLGECIVLAWGEEWKGAAWMLIGSSLLGFLRTWILGQIAQRAESKMAEQDDKLHKLLDLIAKIAERLNQ